MKTRLKFFLPATLISTAMLALGLVFLSGNKPGKANARLSPSFPDAEEPKHWVSAESEDQVPGPAPMAREFDPRLVAALAEKDRVKRKELLQRWARTVPLSALEGTLKRIHSDEDRKGEASLILVTRWTAEKPAATADILQKLSQPLPGSSQGDPVLTDLLGGVTGQWTAANANQAISWAQALPPGEAKAISLSQVSYQLRNIVGQMAETNPQAAAAWARDLPSGEAGESAVLFLTKTWAGTDPAAAAIFVLSLPPGSEKNQATQALISEWAFTKPFAAAAWTSDQPEGPSREQALTGLMTTWAGRDPDAAAQWLLSLPRTPSKDVALASFTSAVVQMDPEAAFQWAETITDEIKRNQQLAEVARIWLAQNPDVARQKITQSNLAPDTKDTLLYSATISRP